jgi:hypothetical protein
MSFPQVIFEPNRFGLLFQLAKNGGQAQSPDLCLKLGLSSRQGLDHHKKKLACAGFVQSDGMTIALTADGRKALAALGLAIDHALYGSNPE